MPTFTWPTRVYWEDTDGGGVVYHANYLRFLERARTEWLRAKGTGQLELLTQRRLQFVVFEMRLRFLKPARLDDQLLVSVELADCSRASFVVEQSIVETVNGTLLCQATADIACVDADRLRPRAMPDGLRASLVGTNDSPP